MPDVGGIPGEQLLSFVTRIERLSEERKPLADDLKEVYAKLKHAGFDAKIVGKIIAERARDRDDLDEETILLDVYRRALGMLPLEEFAVSLVHVREAAE